MAKQPPMPPVPPDSTADLVTKAVRGDSAAANEVARRELGRLRPWARGRVPEQARGSVDTEDLVQDSLLRTFARLKDLNVSQPGALQAYLRQVFRNDVIDTVRKTSRRPMVDELPDLPDSRPSPQTEAAEREAEERVRAARAQLSTMDRRLIEARIDRDWNYERIARVLGKPSANAARIAVRRACERLVLLLGAAPSTSIKRAGPRRAVVK